MSDIIDLRSDTFTLPTPGMRRAIYEAEVGNAGYGEDPSVNRLEEEIAAFFGQQAAVFLPSATMAGQIAIRVRVRQGDMVVTDELGHNYYFETGSMTAIAGAWPRLVKSGNGILKPEEVEAAIHLPENPNARCGLIIVENSSNYGGGRVYPQDILDRIFETGSRHGVPVHVDGARIWNVIVATGANPERLFPESGTMSVCMSKGLGAPMGALLIGAADVIAEARRIQTMLGGVMRQIGFMAAAALYGFHHQMERLAEDHANARLIADILADNPSVEIDPASVETNMLYFRPRNPAASVVELAAAMKSRGVLGFPVGTRIRLVTSLNVSRDASERAARMISALISGH